MRYEVFRVCSPVASPAIHNALAGPYVDTKKGFAAACLAARPDGFTFHDLRHTFATRLKEAGVDPVTRRDLLGHASTVMTDSYTHSAAETKQAAVDSIYHSGKLSPLHFPAKAEQPPRPAAVSA
jgi:integrase